MRFGVLGPLDIHDGRGTVAVPAGRQRVLLGSLLLRANSPVAADELAELIWDGAPPSGAAATLRAHVMRLRKTLGPSAGTRVLTRYPGYLLAAAEDEVDALEFARLCHDGSAAVRAGSWAAGAAKLGEALHLWRGQPLADVPCQALLDAERPRLEQLHLQALEGRNEAVLHLSSGSELIPELEALAREHPLHERFQAQLMRALYMSGRSAEAIAHYQHARTVLVEELGTEPGAELRDLHQNILAGDTQLASPQAEPQNLVAAATLVPRELPAPVGHFTGREAELAALNDLLDERPGVRAPALVISAIGGTAGVGKTALAVQWAHQVAGRFPDGQLYVNLRGYDPDQPVSAADALAGFLRTLGVPGTDVPDEMEGRARMYRSQLAGRRMLLVLDNARDGGQVRPLLPGDPGCVAVVTSRDALAGLVVTDGARRLDLDLLPLEDAVALLRSLIGGRVDADPGAAAELAGLCARLPLALRIAAELAAARPAVLLAELVPELAAARLDLLDAGEDRADVRAVFSWSVRQLPEEVAGAFALTGLHPGADLDRYAAAALIGATVGQARRILGRLHRASLIQAGGAGRYGMHDLLRAYARGQAGARDTGGWCEQALTRLFDYYLAATAAAMEILFPAEAHQRPRIAPAAAVLPAMPGQADARAWLDAERASLAAVVAHCAGHGWPRHATGLAATLFRYLMTGSHLPEAQTIYGHALHAARRSGDVAAEAEALNGLGGIGIMNGHFRDAAGHYRAALERYNRSGDRAGQARVLRNLGGTELQLHNYESAARYFRQAAAACEDVGDSLGAAIARADLGGAETELGWYDQAAEHLRRSLPVLRDEKAQPYEATALGRSGDLGLRRGDLAEAAEFFERALAICRSIDNPVGVASGLQGLGEVSLHRGEYQRAIGQLRQAIALRRKAGDQHGETTALRTLAEALHGAGQSAAARAELAVALRLAAETGNTHQEASGHRDLAESHHRAGGQEQARHHWEQALILYTQLGAPEADEVRSRLAEVSPA
jgi:DNA-binding SARP family transcriptional activator/tetratricopeptide (TPR) repeat protein